MRGHKCRFWDTAGDKRVRVRVRIKVRPREREIDGVSLQSLYPGAVRDVSPLLGSWLIAEEYAEPEMRTSNSDDTDEFTADRLQVHHPRERRRRS
jgi:hypothetical protein